MTRQEEIQKLIDEEMGTDNYGSCDFQVGVIYGVKHADKTMIEKACDWMKEQVYQEYGGGPLERLIPDTRIEEFRKAMLKEE